MKVADTCTCKGCSLWLTLEAERLDRSYLNPIGNEPATPKLRKPARMSERILQERDKLMFNAGRYAAGARDTTATRANYILEREN